MSYRKIGKFREQPKRIMEENYDEKVDDTPNYMKGIEQGKLTFFFNNGNWLDRPKPILVSSRTCRSLSTLYDHCSEVLNLQVRNIFTPGGSTKVNKIADMKNGGYYVGCGNKNFKKRPYNDNLKPWSHGTPRQVVTDHAEFSNKYTNVSSKYQEVSKYHRMRIRVRPFNKPEENPKPAVIDFSKSFETNLMKINQDRKVVNHCLRERETFRLVTSIEELNKDADYILIHANDSQRRRPRTLPTIDTKMKNASPNSVASDPQTRKREARRERPGGIHSRQVKHHHSQDRNGQTDKDNGVFKPKSQNQHTKGAKEIVDTKDTRVDLPIDQVQAEEVEEERIRNDGQHTDRQPAKGKRGTNSQTVPNSKKVANTKKETTQKANSKTNPTPKVADHSHHGGGGHQEKQNTKKHTGTRGEFNNVSPLPPISNQNNDNRSSSPAWSDTDKSKAQKDNEAASKEVEKQKAESKGNDTSRTDDKQKAKKTDEEDKNKKGNDAKKEDMTENEAATKIQAGFRGYQGRKEVTKKKEDAAKN